MDRDDVALHAIRDATTAANAIDGDGYCTNVIKTVAPFFPETLRQQSRIVSIDAGQVVFQRDGKRTEMHCLLWGDVSVQREIMGEAVTVQRAAAGDWLLESAMGLCSTGAFAVCERQSVLLVVPMAALTGCMDRQPGFALAWSREMATQMARMQRRIERISLRQAPQRIIHFLLTESPGGCGEMVLPFRKCVWAAHLGMAPETLSRSLGDLIEAGWLEALHGKRYRLLRAA